MYIVYKVFYKNEPDCVYVGRTKNPLHKRLYQHFTIKVGSKNTVKLDIEKIDYVEYAECDSESDMNLYETYYILKNSARLNILDKSKDKLSDKIILEELDFKIFYNYLIDEWRYKLRLRNQDESDKFQEKQRIAQIFIDDMKIKKETLSSNDFLEWINNMKSTIGYRYYNELYVNKS